MVLEVTSGVMATLFAEAQRAGARECCGLLLGRAGRIEQAVPAANVHPEPERHFEIDPAALIAAHKAARAGGPQVLGYYHSHPTGNVAPSHVDRAMASGDDRVWAVVAGSAIGWWKDGEEGFVPLDPQVA